MACAVSVPPSPLPTTGPTPSPAATIQSSPPSDEPTVEPTDSPEPTPTALPSPNPSPTTAPGALDWRRCAGEPDFDCAALDVPLDYAHPAGQTIRLSLIRHAATSPADRIGSVIVNPGGPGGSGIDEVRYGLAGFGPDVVDRFDIVGFDPRGVGASSPVHCLDPRPELDPPFPRNADQTQQFVDYAGAVTAACAANSGDLLPFMGTENVARDLDQIRAAVGDELLTYVGTSYGTLIGELYADLFPTHIRAMILDGVVDPTLDFERFVIEQSAAAQGQLDEFLASCSADTSCHFHSLDTTRSFRQLMARFARGPIDGVTAFVALYAVYLALAQDDPEMLEQELTLAKRGITFPMDQAAGWTDDAASLDPYEAVNCVDYAAPRNLDEFAAIATEAAQVAPDFGAWNTYGYFDCAFWPAPPSRTPHAVTAPGAPPILVLSATGDPATPYQWGVNVAQQLASGVLVTRVGGGHTSRGYQCVRAIAEDYVLTLAVPDTGTTCS